MAIKSMTAFARSSGTLPACHWTWEVKSVNAKGLDMRFRMPAGFDAIDIAVRDRTAKRLSRGNLFVALTIKWLEDAAVVRVNETLLERLAAVIPSLKTTFPDTRGLSLDGLLSVNGVIDVVSAGEDEGLRKSLTDPLLESYDDTLNQLVAMRDEEGRRMASVLKGQIKEIERLHQLALDNADAQPAIIAERLKVQVKEVLSGDVGIPEDRMAQEIALLVAKADIREELDRLAAHIAAAKDLLSGGSPVGRKLDFLCQEFNREANTICSKAQDIKLTGIGLELKAIIEQFREQVQNIE